jgi:hypothetical protein
VTLEDHFPTRDLFIILVFLLYISDFWLFEVSESECFNAPCANPGNL